MKLSTIRVPAPMAIGPRSVELTISAPASTTTRPSIVDASSTVPSMRVVELLEQQPVGLEQRRQLAGVDPPAGEQLGAHAVAGRDQPLDGVGDLQLAAGRRRDRPHGLVDRRVEQVDADEGEVRRRVLRLLDERRRRGRRRRGVAIPKRCGSGTCLSRIWAAGGSAPARAVSNAATNAARSCSSRLSPRYMTKSSSPRKSRAISTQWARPSGASCGMYVMRGAEAAAVAERGADLGPGVAGDDADLLDPGGDHRVDAVEQDRRVGHRHELLGPGVGDRAQARAGAAGEDQRLHTAAAVYERRRRERRARQSPSLSPSVAGVLVGGGGAGPAPRK